MEWIRRSLRTVEGRLLTGATLLGAVVVGLWPDHARPPDGEKIVAVAIAALAWLFAELSGAAKPSEHDLALFERFRSTLRDRDRSFLREQDFDNSFGSNDGAGLREIAGWTGVAHEFNDRNLQARWAATLESVSGFDDLIGLHTGPISAVAGRFSVHPPNSDPMQPKERVSEAITELNAKASALSLQLENFERYARRRLGT